MTAGLGACLAPLPARRALAAMTDYAAGVPTASCRMRSSLARKKPPKVLRIIVAQAMSTYCMVFSQNGCGKPGEHTNLKRNSYLPRAACPAPCLPGTTARGAGLGLGCNSQSASSTLTSSSASHGSRGSEEVALIGLGGSVGSAFTRADGSSSDLPSLRGQ